MHRQQHPNAGKPIIPLLSTGNKAYRVEGVWFGRVPSLDLCSDILQHSQMCRGYLVAKRALKNLGKEKYHSAGPCKIIISPKCVRVIEVL